MTACENVELKAIDNDPAKSESMPAWRVSVRAIGGARSRATPHQRRARTAPVRVATSRRGVGELIFYLRAHEDGLRSSRYWRAPTADPRALASLLEAAHGVLGVVAKRRRLFIYENVRIHLDEVDGLGSFIELESVLATPGAESPEEAHALATLVTALGLADRATIAGGYLDLGR